ncbi:SDR family oxidoreductase [Neiella marina]|uniref:SDR family oxidoreductase n=1 Tax=Neiella holothuriorum TaxID=2870530 RepID=A0ABS7EEP8_9GAMM|nr:SDR family NAD(P)-dependent oxidoreductase [Neiella holothuriorum]MBW8190821.1 SDR family oxidoreductase [Neiella holothuriorum]
MNIEQKVAIVTGAASGFGKALAIALSQRGATVAALDIDPHALANLTATNQNIVAFPCDVTNHEQVDQVIAHIDDELGDISILINNAGLMRNTPLLNLLDRNERKHSISSWREVMAVNQDGVFFMARSAAEKMLDKRVKGVIINISSIAAKGNIGQTAYSASKAAVEAMSNVWAKELGRFGIRSMCIAPGFIDTSGTHDALEDKMLARWVEQTSLRRTGKINEVVAAVICAVENDFMTGTTIAVDGGLSI